jgi:hypothetical protein
MKSICLNSIPGLNEAMAKARANQYRTRESSLLNLTHDLLGFKVRTLTIRDYVLLDRQHSPFLNRREPNAIELGFFLWVLSPQFDLWCNQVGWRKWFPSLQPFQAFFYGRWVQKRFLKNPPETSEDIVIKCFEYIDQMFFDAPASVKGGGESCLCYLTGWFDMIQSEYCFPTEKMWEMGLPELFQRLNAIRLRHNPGIPQFNKNTDAIRLFVLRGLRSKEFTMEDLADGKIKFPANAFN